MRALVRKASVGTIKPINGGNKMLRLETVKVLLVFGIIITARLPALADECCSYVQNSGMLPTFKPNDKVGFVPYTANIAPEAGDSVVFRVPNSTSIQIKRVVGLPGNRIQMINGELFINGRSVHRTRMPDFNGEHGPVKQWREVLPNGSTYDTLKMLEKSIFDNTSVFEVPAGRYFVLSDNRDNGTDSRVPTMGLIPAENVLGKASLH